MVDGKQNTQSKSRVLNIHEQSMFALTPESCNWSAEALQEC